MLISRVNSLLDVPETTSDQPNVGMLSLEPITYFTPDMSVIWNICRLPVRDCSWLLYFSLSLRIVAENVNSEYFPSAPDFQVSLKLPVSGTNGSSVRSPFMNDEKSNLLPGERKL